jgi:galactokinase
MSVRQRVIELFTRRHGAAPEVLSRAPGRVNLIGEHTDYNDGFVLPMAIDRAVWVAASRRPDSQVVLHAADLDREGAFALGDVLGGRTRAGDNATGDEDSGWLEYAKGMAWVLASAGHARCGMNAVIASDVPMGAGLSSSAALELALGRALLWAAQRDVDPVELARLAQRAEREWVGTQCGIMDQLISAMGRDGHALLIDCRTLACESVPLPAHTRVMILDTGTRRGLVDSAYNARRAQCEQAAATLGVRALRDVDESMLDAHRAVLDSETFRRARHVVSENQRVLDAAAAMRRGDSQTLGQLMDQSHRSLRDDFEVSTPALDAMVARARAHPACAGARMTGAGFGGCAVALVAADRAEDMAAWVRAGYEAETGHTAAVYLCEARSGAEVLPAQEAESLSFACHEEEP